EPAPAPPPPPKKEEDRIPLMWRISFGTLIGMVGLVCITLYHQLNNGITNLRVDLNNLSTKAASQVSKDELNSRLLDLNTRSTILVNSIKDLQQANAAVLALRERSTLLEQQLKTVDNERKDLAREVQQLREKLVALEARRSAETPVDKKPKQ